MVSLYHSVSVGFKPSSHDVLQARFGQAAKQTPPAGYAGTLDAPQYNQARVFISTVLPRIEPAPQSYGPFSVTNQLNRLVYPREKGVCILGSTQVGSTDPLYGMAQTLGRRLVENGFHIVTCGGSGLCRAVSEGAHQVGGHSTGIMLRNEFETNRKNLDVLDEVIVHSNNLGNQIEGVGGFYHRAAYFIVMPGGTITHKELLTVVANAYANASNFPSQKKIIFLEPPEYTTDSNYANYTRTHQLVESLKEGIDNELKRKGNGGSKESFIVMTQSIDEALEHILDKSGQTDWYFNGDQGPKSQFSNSMNRTPLPLFHMEQPTQPILNALRFGRTIFNTDKTANPFSLT